jgi:7-cyano-7-deazaguanine synthase
MRGRMNKGICLCSGGLDSTLALLTLLDHGKEVVPMFIDYNQWPMEKEREAFWAVNHWIRQEDNLRSLLLDSAILKVDLGDRKDKVGSVWGRGISMVGLASMWAYLNGDDYDFIALGNHRGDVGPDCKPGSFDEHLYNCLQEGTRSKIKLELPIGHMDIKQIGWGLKSFSIPFGLMYSCYWNPSCSYRSQNDTYLCPGCRRKALAMREIGLIDRGVGPNCKERTYQSSLAEKLEY